MDNAQLVQMAARIDELEAMVAGLAAYIAISTPANEFKSSDENVRRLLIQASPDDKRYLAPKFQRAAGGPVVVPSQGFFAAVAFSKVKEIQKMADEEGITAND